MDTNSTHPCINTEKEQLKTIVQQKQKTVPSNSPLETDVTIKVAPVKKPKSKELTAVSTVETSSKTKIYKI